MDNNLEEINSALQEVLKEINKLKRGGNQLLDWTEPNFKNIRNIHSMVTDIQEDTQKINQRLISIERRMTELESNQN